MKNDNVHTFFLLSWLQMLNLPALLLNKNTRIGPFPWEWSVLQNPDRERTNQSTGICLGLGLPDIVRVRKVKILNRQLLEKGIAMIKKEKLFIYLQHFL